MKISEEVIEVGDMVKTYHEGEEVEDVDRRKKLN